MLQANIDAEVGLFKDDEVARIIAKVETCYRDKIKHVVGQIFSGSREEVAENLQIIGEQKIERVVLHPDIIEVMSKYNGDIISLLKESGERVGIKDAETSLSLFSKVIWESFALLIFDIIQKKGLENISIDGGSSIRVRVAQDGSSQSSNFKFGKKDISVSTTMREVLSTRREYYDWQEKLIADKKRKIAADKLWQESEARLLRDGIVEYAKTIKRYTDKEGRATTEEREFLRVKNLKIVGNCRDSAKYLLFSKCKNGERKKCERSISEHNGTTYSTLLKEIVRIYREEFVRNFSAGELHVLEELGDMSMYHE